MRRSIAARGASGSPRVCVALHCDRFVQRCSEFARGDARSRPQSFDPPHQRGELVNDLHHHRLRKSRRLRQSCDSVGVGVARAASLTQKAFEPRFGRDCRSAPRDRPARCPARARRRCGRAARSHGAIAARPAGGSGDHDFHRSARAAPARRRPGIAGLRKPRRERDVSVQKRSRGFADRIAVVTVGKHGGDQA